MKVSWRLASEQQPSFYLSVLTSDNIVAYYDDGIWFDFNQDIVIKEPLYWMDIPAVPGE
jgi:hypothetical protein